MLNLLVMDLNALENISKVLKDQQIHSDNYKMKQLIYRMHLALKTSAHTKINSLKYFTYININQCNPFGYDEIKAEHQTHKKLIYRNNRLLHKLIRIQNEIKFVKRNIKNYQNLTLREKEIIQWLSNGYNNREIGKNLFISRCTVEQHRKHINQKLGITSLPHLLQYSYSFNLI